MSLMTWIALLLALGLAIYLFVALMRPESFE